MNVVRFDWRRRQRAQRRDLLTPMLALVTLVAVSVLGWVAVDQYMPATDARARQQASTPTRAGAVTTSFGMCGRERFTCVVDSDTIWYRHVNLRLQSYDTPEPYDGICGGQAEVALAKRASARLLQLLNSNTFPVDTFRVDNTGKRTLATIQIDGRAVGDILIEERLARRWPDGDEWWCS